MLGIFQKAKRLQRENKKLRLQSSKENRFRLECVSASFGPSEVTGGSLWGSPFQSLCFSDTLADLPADSEVLQGQWQEAPWLFRLVYLADILSKLNKVRFSLQGK